MILLGTTKNSFLRSCRAGDFDTQRVLFKPAESKKDLVLIYRYLELFLPVQTTKGGCPH